MPLRIPRSRVLGWARPATCDLVTATVLAGSLSVGPGKQVIGFLSEKVSDPLMEDLAS